MKKTFLSFVVFIISVNVFANDKVLSCKGISENVKINVSGILSPNNELRAVDPNYASGMIYAQISIDPELGTSGIENIHIRPSIRKEGLFKGFPIYHANSYCHEACANLILPVGFSVQSKFMATVEQVEMYPNRISKHYYHSIVCTLN